MGQTKAAEKSRFLLYLIKPSHYDDDGYVIQWLRSAMPSNSLAAVYGIALDAKRRQVLGEDTEIEIIGIDETNTRVRPGEIIAGIKAAGAGMVGLVGVQSNQFPRAVDLARPMLEAGIQVCVGGFHVSGCHSMLPETPPDIVEAMDMGISVFTGEVEGRIDMLLRDAAGQGLKREYHFVDDLPSLEGVPIPIRPAGDTKRYFSNRTTFDSGRGCPFQCSFCTIINVQGRKSRYRTADDIEALLRENYANGVRKIFITDDNFARNKNWEAIFDRMILLHKRDKMRFRFFIQVDVLCHKIPGFIAKAKKAGVATVFIGLENINADNLLAANKRQNKIAEFRKMLLEWKLNKVIIVCGYIVGLPHDTPETVRQDMETIKRELPVDILEFNILTPLPGSADHLALHKAGVPMDSDMNKYDLEHVVTDHPKMSHEEFYEAYRVAWETYFTPDHIETMMRRAAATGGMPHRIYAIVNPYYGMFKIEDAHPLQGGVFRRKYRTDRRHGMDLESPFVFYPRYIGETAVKGVRWYRMFAKHRVMLKRVLADAAKPDFSYTDAAIMPVEDDELTNFEPINFDAEARVAAGE